MPPSSKLDLVGLAEVAELLGTSAGTVRVQLHRAHAALRDTIMEAEHA